MSEKYIELNLNDEKAGKVAEVLSNKTAKKILGLLAEEKLSQGDIAKRLKIGLNNVDYNIKKLIDSGLIEKTPSFFWSIKGKKIPTYTISNKKIIISTKNSFKGLLGSAIFGGLILGGIKVFMNYKAINSSRDIFLENAPLASYSAAPKITEASQTFMQTTNYFQNIGIWIIVGITAGVLIFFILKKVKLLKGGKNKI